MKKYVKVLAIGMMLSSFAFGQTTEKNTTDAQPAAGRAKQRAEQLKAKLQLTDEQYTKVYDQLVITEGQLQKQQEEMRKIRDEHRKSLEKINADNSAAMKKILTDEQYTQLQEMKENRRAVMNERRDGKPQARPGKDPEKDTVKE